MAEFNRPPLPENYWWERAEWMERNATKDVDKASKILQKEYNSIRRDIEDDITAFLIKNQHITDINNPVSTREYLQNMDYFWKEMGKATGDPKTDEAIKKFYMGKVDEYNARYRYTRLEALHAQIDARLSLYGGSAHHTMRSTFEKIYKETFDRKQYTLQRGLGYGYQYATPNFKAIDEAILYPWAPDGSMFSERLWDMINNQSEDFIQAVRRTIASGVIAQGKNPRKVAKDIVGFGNQNLSASKLQYQAERLLRTESNHIMNEAAAKVSEEWGFTHYEYAACLDHRTSLICRELDGQKFKFKERVTGINFPPMHPNCRSTYTDYIANAPVGTRVARGLNGEWVTIPATVSYKEWQQWQKTGVTPWAPTPPPTAIAPTKVTPKPVKGTKTASSEPEKSNEITEEFNPENFPAWFKNNAQNKAFANYINKVENKNPNIVKIYNSLNKLDTFTPNNIAASVKYVKSQHHVGAARNWAGELVEVMVQIPKIGKENLFAGVQTTSHELGHLIDFAARKNPKLYADWFSSAKSDIFTKIDTSIGDKVRKVMSDADTKALAIRKKLQDDYDATCTALSHKYANGDISFTEYTKQTGALLKQTREKCEYEMRNEMNGVNALEDIYDAISGGILRDHGTVLYGHGVSYYTSNSLKIEETWANYCSLSLVRPDLIELLAEDKPDLVEVMKEIEEELLKKVGS